MINKHSTALPIRRTAIAAALALASSPALTQSLVLEEVIVTAQKRTENVQDIAATVNVVTGQDLTKFEAFNFNAIEQQTAGLTLSSPNARNSSIAMRGVATDPEAGVAAGVDTYWNDISTRADLAFSQLYDMARVEILRGPQGTLQGRTSPAGAIKFVTTMPDLDEAGGYVSATGADNDGANGQFAYGVPIIDGELAVRVAAVYDQNNSNDVTNLTTGEDDPQSKATSGRLSAVWQPAENFRSEFAYQYFTRSIDDPKGMQGVDSLDERPTLTSTDRKALGKSNDYGDIDFNMVSLNINWDLGDFQLASVTGYNDSYKKSRTENDRAHYVTIPEALTYQKARTKADTWTQELRLSSSVGDWWDYMVGVMYVDQNTTTRFKANTTVLAPTISFYSQGKLPVDGSELGIYTFNTFRLNEQWQVEAGLRYTYYDRSRASNIYFGDLNYITPPLAQFEDQIRASFEGNFPIFGVSPENQSEDEDAVTGSLKLRYNLTDDINLYTSYSRGYRPGGISIVPSPNVEFLPNGENDLLHDSETSDSVELGFKSRLMDGRASLNGALYYVKYDGYLGFVRGVQVLDDAGIPVDLPGGIIYNGDANVWGADLEGQILLTETWSFGASASYVHSEWDGATAPCNDRVAGEILGNCDIDGDAISGEPEWSASFNSEYYFPLDDTEVYIRALYKYTDERDNTEASAGLGLVDSTFDATNIVNLYTGWRASNQSWDVSLWVKNLTDEDSVTFQQGPDQYDLQVSGGSYTQTNILQERTIGVTARYSF